MLVILFHLVWQIFAFSLRGTRFLHEKTLSLMFNFWSELFRKQLFFQPHFVLSRRDKLNKQVNRDMQVNLACRVCKRATEIS